MRPEVLLLTPPFTQLNTPYPATQYLKGYLNTLGINSQQADLGIDVFHQIFCKDGLKEVFDVDAEKVKGLETNLQHIYGLRFRYIQTIDNVIGFLCGKNPTLAYEIADRQYLPEAARFETLMDLDLKFGEAGIQDLAKHLSTLYLEDLGDWIKACKDPHFAFTRYAESLASSASSFDDLYTQLQSDQSLTKTYIHRCLKKYCLNGIPDLLVISLPFPGNVLGGLLTAQWFKKNHPQTQIAIGGGYVNTELRRVNDERLFEFIDYICLDDGEKPLQNILEYLQGRRPLDQLKRCFVYRHGVIQYINGDAEKDVAQRDTGTPDYSGLPLDKYLSFVEIVNPMHRLWSDGRWNKLTLAHGCYWGKCSFCDVSLDYIQRYEPITASQLCDRIQSIVAQTGETGFHFVDEAAPPALMGELALELIRRGIKISWWTNIRFEKSFTLDLCKLLKASGCIAVTGGLEVASDRLLALMKKGVTVEQVSRVAHAFTEAGIMVHAYLMYGFPTQTEQETVDSLEVVRQLFKEGVLLSGFWHRFAMTAHSPVGIDPAAYKVIKTGPEFKGFAENEWHFEDPEGGRHEKFSEGLRISLFNYMNGAGLELPLDHWFDFVLPRTSLPPRMIKKFLKKQEDKVRSNARVYYIGDYISAEDLDAEYSTVKMYFKNQEAEMELFDWESKWMADTLPKLEPASGDGLPWVDFVQNYIEASNGSADEEDLFHLLPALKLGGLIIV
ncbi:MAG: radical SAM protein [Saprospiraceae bacterium]|nr:radical SAM protein [Saprospiraceae bacterium]